MSFRLRCLCIAALSITLSSPVFSGTKVAFTGDQGTDENARAVLNMIANEGVDLVLIQGDLGYDRNAAGAWEANLNDALGSNFPVLSVVGNHENFEWHLYHQLIKRRIDRASGLECSDNPGVKSHCRFGNIEIVQVSPGIREVDGVRSEDGYADYIADKFSGSSNKWRICSWHKNMADMQTGSKSNTTGWDVYRSCLNAGALVAVAHEHAYSRTHLLSSFQNKSVVHKSNEMTLEPGKSFMFVSGLGGRSIREQKRGGDWWASIYTATQGATHGALICDFEQTTAQCSFKAIDGSVPDRFSLRLNGQGEPTVVAEQVVSNQPVVSTEPLSVNLPAVFKRTDADELRWIDKDVSGQVGSVWIDKACAEALGGSDVSGDWDQLIKLAPGIDSIESPCNNNAAAPPPPAANNTAQDGSGYVFRRTDKDELRWIAKNGNGQIGSVRIDESCAANFGGPSRSGDWFDLLAAAPAFDELASPCDGAVQISSNSASAESGYVFARTDKDEKRWIARTSSGQLGSVRINKTCASNMGGDTVFGDWQQLVELAPVTDGVPNPCTDSDTRSASVDPSSQSRDQTGGYIFKRTDNGEYRWIAKNGSGQLGSVRINQVCAQQLGTEQVTGDWFQLLELAPGFDTIGNPCMN